MKVLRSVLAVGVGFALTPWLGRGAYAADPTSIDKGTIYRSGSTTNLIVSGTAHIYAENAANGVGLNAFDRFTVGNNELANLYFQKQGSNDVLHTLVNTVNDRISIYGTVNAIRNNKVGGNLYFLSSKGMVVGAKGAINAGSLTVMTSGNTFGSAEAAAQAITDKNWGGLDEYASIDIHGKINTATGIDLRAAYINVTKTGTDAPLLKTGAMFSTIVNSGKVEKASVADGRLTATVDNKGNIVIADPNATSDDKLKGDGSIKLAASSDSRNTNTEFLGVTGFENTAEAKVEVGTGSDIDALGDVDISADASIKAQTKILHFVDMSGYAKADVTVDGTVRGNNVNISSSAKADYSGGNFANLMDMINDGTGQIDTTIKSNVTNMIWGKLEKAGKVTGGVNIANNIVNQLYMPFNLTDAKATTTIGSNANVQTVAINGGNISITAASEAANKMKVGLQPKLNKGDVDLSKYFTGGFIYEDSTSKAIVNVDGSVIAEKNLTVKAKAENENSSSLAVKAPKVYKTKNPGPNDPYDSPMVAVGVGIAYQDTTAEVNIGKKNAATTLSAGKKLSITAASDNTMSSDVAVELKSDTAFNVAVNVVGSEGTATVNNYGHLNGGTVNIASEHTLSEFSVSTSNEIVGEYTGLDWLLDTNVVRSGADKISDFVKSFSNGSQQAAGNNVQAPAQGGGGGQASTPAWNDYFDIGASVTVASSENNAKINLKPTSSITSTGDVAVNANIDIADSNIVTGNVFVNTEKATEAVVSAAVAVENMNNTSEVNLESDGTGHAYINAGGAVEVTATAEQRYNRAKQLVQDLKDAVNSFLKYWQKEWGSQKDLNKKLGNLQNIIVDLDTMLEKDDAASFKESDKFVGKAKAGLDIITSLTGTEGIKKALEAFFDVSNYVNMHVSTGISNDAEKVKEDVTAAITGSVGVQNLHNTANVNIGGGTTINAGNYDLVTINADVEESNVLLIGKMALLPDMESLSDAKSGLGGSVGVQNSYSNSKVNIMNNVNIDAGSIAIGTNNDVMNIGVVFGGSQTSKLGITGMVSYMGGESHAETLIDDDVEFIARKKVERVTEKDENGNDKKVDKVTSSGAVDISSANKTIVVDVVGDWNSSKASSVGVSTGVVSYDVNSIAEVTNQELKADGTSAETSATANHKGSITANSVKVSALTDGVINNLTIAGVNSSKSQNSNAAAGGVNVAAAGGQAANGVQNAQINGGNAGGQDAKVKINAVGSVSWNYIVDETRATLDNVKITLTPLEIGADVTDSKLKDDVTGSVRVEAEDASYIGAYSGAMALTKLGNNSSSGFQGSLAGAVAVNDLKKNTTSTLKNSDIVRESNANVGVDVLNYAHNSGAQVAAGLSLGLEVGKRSGGVDVNLAASGSANYVDSTVHADMLSNAIAGGNSTIVNNVAYDKDVQVAGGVTVEIASATASVGAAVTVNDVKNDIQAAMNNNKIGAATLLAKEVHNVAASNLTQVGTAVSVGVVTGEKSYATLNVAVASNKINNTVNASTDGGIIYADKFSDEAKDGKVSLDEDNNKYLTELNTQTSSAVTVNANGDFVKDGVALQRAYAVEDNGQKTYKVYTLNNDGQYEDASGGKLTSSILTDASGEVIGIEYKDSQGRVVDVTDVQYRDNSGNIVDVNAVKTEQKHYFDLDGSEALAHANGANGFDVDASVGENAQRATYTSSKITLSNQGNTIVGVALGLGVKAGSGEQVSGAGAAAANVNTVTNDFTATVKNATIGTAPSTYTNGQLTEAMRVEAASDTRMVSVAAGVTVDAQGKGASFALAGSGAAQNITNTTSASVENSTVSTDNLAVKGTTESSLVSVAGQVSVGTSDKGVAAGLTWAENTLNNTTGAYAKGITLNGISNAATNLAVVAENKSKVWAVAVGASVSLGNGAAEGAYVSNNGKNNTEAIVDKYGTRNNSINKTKNISVTAKDTTVEKGIAGSIAVAAGNNAMASLGGAVVYNNIGKSTTDKQIVKAQLNNANITTADGATMQTKAINDADFLGLALGGAVRAATSDQNPVGVSAEGSVAVTTDYMNTIAGMENVNIDQSSGSQNSKVEVEANSTSDITSSADALAVSVGDGIKISGNAAVSKVRSDADTTTEIKNSIIKAQDVIAKANSTNEILDVAIGLSAAVGGGSASVALAGNVATNRIDNDTTVTFANDDIYATGTVAALSDSYERLRNYGGAISAGVSAQAGVALGATVVTNTIEGDTEAVVKNSNIIALGGGNGVKIDEHNVIVDNEKVGETTDHIQKKGTNKVEDVAAASATTRKGLVVNADAQHLLRDVSVTGGVAVGGDVGVALDGTAVFNKITGATNAKVNNTNVNKGVADLSKADVFVNAYDKADISSHVAALSIGVGMEGVGVGAAGAGDSNIINREVTAQILGGTTARNTLNAHNAKVNSLAETQVYISQSGVGVGAGAEGAAGVTATGSHNEFTNHTNAIVGNVDGTVHELVVDAERVAKARAFNNSIALSGAYISLSGAVAVTNVYDAAVTSANLSNSILNADGNSNSKVEVLANNSSDIETELAGISTAISIGGSVSVSVMNTNSEAQAKVNVEDAVIGTEEKRFGSFNAKSNNKQYNKFQNIQFSGGSIASIGVGKGAVTINSKSATEVENVAAYANNINISANETRTTKEKLQAGNVGIAVVGVNLLYTTIGDSLKDSYTYDRDGNDSNGGSSNTSEIQVFVNDALKKINSTATKLQNSEHTRDAGISGNSQTINKGNATKGGTSASVTGGVLNAAQKLTVDANATTNIDAFSKAGAVGGIAVAVTASHIDVKDNINVILNNAALKANTIDVTTKTDGLIKNYVGQGGFTIGTYADTTAYVKHHGENIINIDNTSIQALGAATADMAPLNIKALNYNQIDNKGLAVNITGVAAGRLVLEGEDTANVSVNLGKQSTGAQKNTITAAKAKITAQNAPSVKDAITGVAVGGLEFHGAIVESKATGKANLELNDKNTFEGQKVEIEAITGARDDEKNTVEATNHAVSVTIGDITVNKARTRSNMEATTNIGAASFRNDTGFADVYLGASNAASSYSYVHSVLVNGLSSGSNFAQAYSNGKATVTVDSGESIITANKLEIAASNSDDTIAKANGTDVSVIKISPYAAQVENTSNTTTTINVTGNINTIDSFNAHALRKDEFNFWADNFGVVFAGGGDTYATSSITDNTNVNIKNANITSGGDMFYEAENMVVLNRKDGFDRMVSGSAVGAANFETSGVKNTITSNANVNFENAIIKSGGDLTAAAHTKEDLLVNAYVYSLNIVGSSTTNVYNTITNNDKVTVKNSKLRTQKEGSDLTLSAADDMKIFSYAYGEIPASIFGFTDANITNNFQRNNSIELIDSNTLYSTHDVNLFAGKLADGSLSTMDIDMEAAVFNGSVGVLKPRVYNTIDQNNIITLSRNTNSTSVRHTNLYADRGFEMSRITSARYFHGLGGREESFATSSKGETTKGETHNNYVDISGKVTAGIANHIDITIGEVGDIVILDDTLRSTVAGAKKDSQIKVDIVANESLGLTRDSLTFGTEDYANTLLDRYEEVNKLMLEYKKDGESSAAYLGYLAESQRIQQEMISLGLAEYKDNVWEYKGTLKVDYVEIPELTGSGGNIVISTNNLKSSSGTGALIAQGTPAINITNNTNLMLKVNSITVDDPGGKLVFNDQNITGSSTSAFNGAINKINTNKSTGANFGNVQAAEGQSGSINIKGNYSGTAVVYEERDDNGNPIRDSSGRIITGSIKPMANIQIQGNIFSKEGLVNVYSKADSILIQGKSVKDAVSINGATITLDAAKGSITQGYTDGIVNIGSNVRQDYDKVYEDIIEYNGNGTYDMGDLSKTPTSEEKASGSYIAGGTVFINASDINVNGIIQSGFGDYYVEITADLNSKIQSISDGYDGSREISDAVVTSTEQYKLVDGGAYWDSQAGCYKYKLNVYYNPSTQKIIVQDVNANGGKVYLTGRIASTGGGKIVCLDGVSNIAITNSTNYDLQLGDLTTTDAKGLVSITDTGKNTLTEITKDSVVVKNIGSRGTIGSIISSGSYSPGYYYQPKEGLSYSWTTGKQSTTYRRYKIDDVDGGWGLWNNGATESQLANWKRDKIDLGGGTTDAADRNGGITIREDGISGNKVTISSQKLDEPTVVKESERRYKTGLWGFHKHYEVIWTESQGTLYTYDASVQADKRIGVSFVGSSAENGAINVTTNKDLYLTGNIGNTKLYEVKNADNVVPDRLEKGTVNLTTNGGSIIQSGGSLYGSNINLVATKDMKNISITAGDTVNVSAVHAVSNQSLLGQNTIDVTVNAAYLAKGNVVLGNMGSTVPVKDSFERVIGYDPLTGSTGVTGIVNLSVTGSEGNISQKDGNVRIVSDRINLNTNSGAIYGQKVETRDGQGNVIGTSYTSMKVYAGQQPVGLDTMDASVNASAKGDINLEQVDGNMRVGTIYSHDGDVTLTVTNGSVEDALDYDANDRGDADDLLARWRNLGIVTDGDTSMIEKKTRINSQSDIGTYEAWDTYALLYAIQDSIVNPETSALPSTSHKDPNIIGHNITINVADSVGMNSGIEKRIDVNTLLAKDSSGNYTNLQDLQALSKLDASTRVEWVKDQNTGHTYAVYTETIPLGIQQTVQKDASGKDVYGKLTIQTAANSTNLNGDIFLQGREQKLDANGLASAITNNKNIYINNIWTTIGEITVTSLGGIYNVAGAGATAITGKNLVLTAANGSIGTAANHITTNLLGADKNVDGLSAIATGGIYMDQKGSNGLIVRNVSSGGDIYLGSDKGILMGFVNGSDADSYIRAENNGDIVLEARGGSIGEVAYEADGTTIKRDANNGVRILNSATKSSSASDKNATNVVLRASDSVYVTGVASRDGKTAVAQGPAGVLNLTVEGENASGSALTLNNVGIYVDGALNLENTVQASKTASVYVTDDLNLGNSNKFSISAPDIFMGSAKTVTLAGAQSIAGSEKLTVQAGLDLYMNRDALTSKNLNLAAARNVYLNGGSLNTTVNVNVHAGNNLTQAGTAITAHNSTNTANVQLTADNKMYLNRGSLTADKVALNAYNAKNESGASLVEATSNYKLSTNALTIAAKGATLDSRLNQLHNVVVDKKSSGNIVLGNGNTTNADLNVSLGNSFAGSKLNGSLTVHNYASGAANKLVVDKLLGATGEINLINDETDINVASGAAITANNVLLQAKSNSVNVNGGSVAAASKLTLDAANVKLASGALQAVTAVATASKDITMTGGNMNATTATMTANNNIAMNGGSMNATTATMTAGNNINLTNGALQANTASLVARNGNITEAASGYVLDVANLTATAKSNITLDSSANQLEKVSVANTAGNVAIGSGNSQNANALAVTTNGQIKGNLSIINYADSSSYNNAIVFDNNLKATENITITNQEAGINVNKNAAIEGANVALTASTSANITGGTISTGSMDIYANNASISGGNISTDDMDVYANNANISGGTISADDMDIEANNATISGGSIKAKAIDIDANNNATISGGNVEANIIDVAAQNAMINGGTVKGANIHVNAIENVNVNGGQMQGTDIAWNAINVTVGGGSVQATNLNVAVNNNLQLNGGNLTADVARLTSEGGTIKQQYDAKQTTNKGTVYAKDLYITTKAAAADGLTVDLGNRYNKFSNIYITDATKGELSLGSSNDAAGALRVSVLNGASGTGMLQGSLTVHNYANGAANKLLVNDNLTTTGTITLINDEANIEIADDGVGAAANLQAHKITLDSNYDIIHRSGTIVAVEGNGSAASGKIDLDADGSILLLGGSMSATNVDMLAIDHIYEKYDNNAQGTAASGYALTVNGTLTVLTTGGSTVDYGIDLGSRYNQLHRVIMDSDKGNIILGNGGSQNLEVEVESGNQVQGSIVIHNYAGGSPNDIVVVKDLKARDNIDLINDERDIIITRDNASVVEATNVILEAQLSIINEATIAAKNDATLYAHGVTLKADDEAIYNIGDINAAGEINHATDAGAIYNTGTMQGTKGVVMLTNKDNNETTGNIINSGHILTDRNAIIDSWGDLKNTGNIKAGGYVDLDASGDVVNGDAASSITGQIIAGREVYLTSWKGNVTNYDNIQSLNGEVVLENGYVYTLDDNNNTTLVNNIINTGSIMAKEDVLLRTFNGSIDNEAIIESEAASVTIEALKSKQCTGTSANEIGVIRNTGDAGSGNNADIMAAQNITLNAAASIINLGDFYANRGNIQVNAGDTILNTGNYGIKEMGDITVISNGGDVLNMGHYYTKSGAIHMEAQDDLVNMGVMESEKGDINLTSLNGSLYNEAGADLLAGDGDITLSAKSNKAGYYYTVYNEQNKSIDEVYVAEGTPIYDYDDFGGKYIIANGEKQDVVKNGSVFNAGDAMAINGTIRIISEYGDVTNYDDFNTLLNANGDESEFYKTASNPNGIDIATGNVELLAAHGTLYNTKDLESGQNITLMAAKGLTNFAYNVYAGKNISLTATEGDVLNTATLESYAGDVTLQAYDGNVINGAETGLNPGKGDIITYGGNVTLLAQGSGSVTNYGDIIAINANATDKVNSGSITLKSEHHDVDNFDDFNTYRIGDNYYKDYKAIDHGSIESNDASYNLANNNLTISAREGHVFNNKDYLVALGNVELEAKTGLSSFGQAIYAGKNITMTATEGDLFNKAELLSVEGDITLKAEKGTVVNLIGGDMIARNGNVTLEAGAEANNTIRYVDAMGNAYELHATQGQAAGDSIVITKQFYKDTDRKWVEMVKTNDKEVVAPASATEFQTEIWYLQDYDAETGKKNEPKLVTTITGDKIGGLVEAYRTGDVVNRGDIVAQGDADAGKGAVTIHSHYGNTTNYDNFKLFNGEKSYDYLGETGSEHQTKVDEQIQTIKVKFNPGTAYYYDAKGILLSDSDMNLIADKGYLYNNMNIISEKSVNLTSGKTLTIGTNVASVIAKGDVLARSNYGYVINDSHIESKENSIVLDGELGVTSQVGAANLSALNGSISAVTTQGEVFIDELIAGQTAAAGVKEAGSVKIGDIKGKDVVLYTENADATITIEKSITVEDHLLLQGNSFDLPKIQRTNLDGTLIVDVNGVGAGSGSAAMKGDLNLTIDGDVRFTTMNVTNANVEIGGKLSIDKLHVAGAGHFTGLGFVTGVYGGSTAPYHDSSNALYYDLGTGSGDGAGMRVSADEFRAVKEGTSATVRALETMKSLKERFNQLGIAPDTFNKDNSGWMNLYVDTPRYQRSNGLLLHIDTGYRSANQRWSAEDLSAKLMDFKAHEAFSANYSDVAGTFGRYYLVEVSPNKPVGEILHTANENTVVLQRDNSGLRIEAQQENEQEEKKNEA